MIIQVKTTMAALLLAASSFSHAVITGDVTGGGVFYDSVSVADGWGSNYGSGVDFWTLTVGDNTSLSVAVSGTFDYGISIYEGVVESDFTGAFDNNEDYSYMGGYAAFVDGTPDLFGPFNSLETLLDAGTYTIAVGGVAGFAGPLDYSLSVQAVPVPAAAWLFGSALLGLVGVRRKR